MERNIQYNLDFDISRLFGNGRLSDNLKKTIKLRLFDTENFINKYELFPFFAGLSTYEEIESKIPDSVWIYDKEFKADELKKNLLNLSAVQVQKRIEEKVQEKIDALIENKFDPKKGIFNFIKAGEGNDVSNSKKCIDEKSSHVPKVWINTLCVFVLIKWQLFTNSQDSKLFSTIYKTIEWLNKNKEVYGWLEYCKGTNNIIKLFETTITLQALLRASKVDYILDELDFENDAKKILDLQKHSNNGSWPSEIEFIKSNDNNSTELLINKYTYIGAVGATSCAIHFLDEFLDNREDSVLKGDVINSLEKGYKWLIDQQQNGYWMQKDKELKDKESIDFTTNAIQSLIKCGKYFYADERLEKSIYKGLEWLGDQFCIETTDDIIYAWPKDDYKQQACEKNTAYVITTLLKAGIPNDSFIIRRAMLWLLEAKPKFDFDEVYVYCAMLEYLKSLAPGYKTYFPFNHST